MPDGTVTPLHPRAAAAYTDTAALNDIHALLTATEPGQAALKDIALILARTGRPMTPARDIEVRTTETALGWPVACVDAGDTNVYVRQAPSRHGPAHRDLHRDRRRGEHPHRHPRRRPPAPRWPR